MPSLNKVFLIGNLTKDVELRYIPSGEACATLSLAVNEKYGEKDSVLFMDCVAWKKTAENCAEYLKKGSPVFVEGKLKTRSWDKDGVKHYKTEVVVFNVQFLGSPKQPEGDAERNG